MKYIIIILFALSLSVAALQAAAPQDEKAQTRELHQKIQKELRKKRMCDPEKEVHLPPFN